MPDLKVIGITGSYGKTSTKHYLERILSEQFETLMTPGSFNTTLGVVRTVNEKLKPYHEIFIVEMGAKQKNDIKEICNLVCPSMGIISAVGPQHLETFGTIENVRDTKFELAYSLPKDGTIFLNNDYEIIAETPITNCKAIRYSCETSNKNSDYIAEDIVYNKSGTTFTLVCPSGKRINFETSILGKYNIANLTGAIALAIELNVPEDRIRYSVSKIQAVDHRLSHKLTPQGFTILDDAFNSNPLGASMAVEVLAAMDSGKKIIITPGMIELGSQQFERNKELGRKIALSGIDLAVIVGEYNRESLLHGLKEGGMLEEQIKLFDSFVNAYSWILSIVERGDTVLIENDLPDTYK